MPPAPARPSQPDREKDPEKIPAALPPPYSAFPPWRRRFILSIVTIAGFFGPLAGGIYLPALPVLQNEFHASATAINITVSVFMLTFAFAVSSPWISMYLIFWRELTCDAASVLVKFRRLEGPPSSVPYLHRHLHRRQYPPGYRAGELRRPRLSSHGSGVWLFGRGLHGRRLRC